MSGGGACARRRHGPLRRQLLRVAGHEARRVAHRHVRRIGVAPVGHDLHRLRPSGAERLAVARGDRQRHPRASPLQVGIDLVQPGDERDDGEIRRGVEPLHELAARRRSVRVGDDDRDVPDVGGGRVAEHQELQDRREDDDHEEAAVLLELDELLPDEEPDAAEALPEGWERHQVHCLLNLTDASASMIAAKIVRAARSCQSVASPAPFSTMPRSAIRKYRAGTT